MQSGRRTQFPAPLYSFESSVLTQQFPFSEAWRSSKRWAESSAAEERKAFRLLSGALCAPPALHNSLWKKMLLPPAPTKTANLPGNGHKTNRWKYAASSDLTMSACASLEMSLHTKVIYIYKTIHDTHLWLLPVKQTC